VAGSLKMRVTDWPRTHFSTSLYFLGSSECDQSGISFTQKNSHLFYRDEEGPQAIFNSPCILQCFSLKKTIVQVVCGGMHSLALTSSGELWSWGCPDNGVLGYDGEAIEPRRVPIENVVVQCSAGDTHSMAITLSDADHRSVYFWGIFRVSTRQNGDGEMCEAKTTPEMISAKDLQFNRPLKLASGFNHVVLLTQDNKLKRHVFSWGDCSGGKIGRIPSSRRRTQNALKIRALGAKNVTNVWACGNHSFYQFQTPASAKRSARLGLCAWGLNNDGQLGLGHHKEVVAPCEVPTFEGVRVLEVCGGEFHTLILTERQEVYSCGLNRDGQLGISSDLESSADPMPVILPEAVAHIASGGHFNYAVTVSGEAYSWGTGDNYVLGTVHERSESRPVLVNPKLLNSEAVLCAVAGGQHGLFLTTDLHSQSSRPTKRGAADSAGSSAKRKKDL